MALNFENVATQRCRTCLEEGTDMWFAHDRFELIEDADVSLSKIILLCTSIQVSEDDLMPQYVCKQCANVAKNSYEFRVQCEKSNELLKTEGTKIEIKLVDTDVDDHDDQISENKLEDKPNSREPKDSKELQYKCDHCNVSFAKQASLRNHLKKNHAAEQRTCDQCGKTFQFRTSMMKHRRKHDLPPKSCTYCDVTPATPVQLAKHMEKEHAHLKTIVCPECGKTFFKESNLRIHLVMHSGVKRHTCEICGVSFALGGNLVVHRRVHTGEKPYTCSHCGRGFTQHAALRSHEVGHLNVRDHVCPDCGAAFSRAGALRNHRKRHLPNRPFVCSMCGKAFTFSSERKRHMNIHTGVKNHVCDVCGRRFNRNTNLKVHMRTHTGETPYVCHVCGKGFIQAHCLRTHMNTHKESK